ncbi:MAG TPA: DUF1361 domain-containing protein [Roseiflexaceae bacterium]|nr:DUF1361 domain-containing protein [Roseiflexaceae bacterium]
MLVQQIRSLHRFLTRNAFYALAISSAFAIGILAARVLRAHQGTYIFLVWNLFLAWVPYGWSLWADSIQRRHPRDWWRLLIPGALWLLFFPNAPYIVTDFVHLYERPPVPLWYDIGLLATFAWSGCFLAVVSLQTMQRLVRQHCGALLSWLFVCASIGLSGLGVYLGRFERWNSWDLLIYPHDVLAAAARPILFPLSHIRSLGASAMFATILLICYVTFMAVAANGHSSAIMAEE